LTRSIQKGKIDFSSGKISPEGRALLQGLLDRDPSKRLTAEQTKNHAYFAGTNWEAILRKEYFAPFTPGTEANISAQYDLEEQFAQKRGGRILTEQEQAFFKDWDYNPEKSIGVSRALLAPSSLAVPQPAFVPPPVYATGITDDWAGTGAENDSHLPDDLPEDINYADYAGDILKK